MTRWRWFNWFIWWAWIFTTLWLTLLSAGCAPVKVQPFVYPGIDEPKFPRDYGVMVKWEKEL